MKNFFYKLLLLLSLALIFCLPRRTFIGATNGLILWFQTILPTLLPFIILSNLLINTGFIHCINKIIRPIISKFFSISESACYSVLIGFLCGYPMGAKSVNDLVKNRFITENEGRYLLSFCNNASPMFIISFIVLQTFSDTTYTFGSLLILMLSPLLCSFIFRHIYKHSTNSTFTITSDSHPFAFNFIIFEKSIMDAFETITKIGGYIIIFSILCSYLSNSKLSYFTPILELSTGIPTIMSWNIPFRYQFVLILSLTSFGGICAIAQSGGMLKNSKISMFPYIIQKLITALVTSLLAFIYITFIHS